MAAVDASPRPENLDPNPDSGNPSSTPNQNSSTAENHNPASLSNPSPSINPHPSTPVQASAPPIGTPTFASPYAHIGAPQYAAVPNPNPSFQMGQAAGLQPPGVGSPAIVGSSAGSPASPMMRPVGMYQAVPGQHPVQMQYGQVQNGYMAAGAIPPPGVPRFPSQYPGLIRPGFAPRPIPQIMRPNIAGIRPAPPMAPLLRPVNPVSVEKPQTTVYVGKIAPTVDNDFLLSLLKLCGPVKSWKRAQDPSDGKPKGFGFCEFEGAEGILRALRLLSKLNLDGQELVLNINQATRDYLEKYVEKKTEREKFKETESLLETSDPTQSQTEPPKSAAEESKKESSDSPKDSSKDSSKDEAQKFGVVNDEDRKADKEAVEKIESMLEERAKSLPPPPPLPPPKADPANRAEIPSRVKDDWDSDQIRSGEKNSEGDVSESNKGGNEVEASSGRSRRERSRERERERSNRDKEREREKEREADRYERDRERDRVKREREREDRVRQSDRQLKDRLKDWENREREREYQRHHERDREKERERERKREVVKQEDESEDEGNNNERDRKRRRRGGNINNIEERKRKRQREKEEDVSDRLKEEEETEEQMRRERELEKERLLREEEIEKEKELEKEKEEQLKREMYVKDVWNEMYGPAKEERESVEPMQVDLDTDNNSNNSNTNNNSSNGEIAELGQENVDSKFNTTTTNNNNGATKKLGFGLFGSGKKASVPSVFQQEEEEEQNDKKMRPLVPIDYSAEELQAVSQTDSNEEAAQTNNVNAAKKEKKKGETKKVLDAKQLIDMIPKTKEELFSYPINWTVYDKHGLNERMRPWISKKITEFLGEEEETLVDYIVSCTRDHVEASKLLELLQAILDEEAEMFVLKMWRMLIFEIKKVETGIAKGK